MTVGILDAPLISSLAGNLAGVNYALLTFLSTSSPCYFFHFWNLSGIEDAGLRDKSVNPQSILSGTYLYDIPLYVVPTSKARTSFRRRDPRYGVREDIIERLVVQ